MVHAVAYPSTDAEYFMEWMNINYSLAVEELWELFQMHELSQKTYFKHSSMGFCVKISSQ